jgi:hypothetical protein
MKVRVLRPFWYGGVVKKTGDEVDLPDHLAREVVFGGKAELVVDRPAKPSPPTPPAQAHVPAQAPAKQPMTTKSAPALAGKKGD